jgi:hypothetical protein
VTSAHCGTSYCRLLQTSEAMVRSQIPGEGMRTRLLGALADGGECQILDGAELQFFSAYPPANGETMVARYRSRGRAVARVADEASIAAHASGADDGVRAAAHYVAAPAPRTSEECETAARAVLDDSTQQAWAGEYRAGSETLAADVWPGDAVAIEIPSRNAECTAIVREVEIECEDLEGDAAEYRIAFANDAAEPLGFRLERARLEEAVERASAGAYVADLAAAEITGATATTIDIDAGNAPPEGGGVEARRSDRYWGAEDDRDLIGRFATQAFSVGRLARTADVFLRQYDGSTPRKYSRHSTLLHLDWPYL